MFIVECNKSACDIRMPVFVVPSSLFYANLFWQHHKWNTALLIHSCVHLLTSYVQSHEFKSANWKDKAHLLSISFTTWSIEFCLWMSKGWTRVSDDGSCLYGWINKTRILFSFKKRTRPLRLLSSGKLNGGRGGGGAKLLKVMVLVTAVV